VSYSTKHKYGIFNKSIKVYSDDPTHPKLVLYLTGHILKKAGKKK